MTVSTPKVERAFANLISKEIKLRNKSLADCFCIDDDGEFTCMHLPIYGGSGQMSATATFRNWDGKVVDIFFVERKNYTSRRPTGERVEEFTCKLTALFNQAFN